MLHVVYNVLAKLLTLLDPGHGLCMHAAGSMSWHNSAGLLTRAGIIDHVPSEASEAYSDVFEEDMPGDDHPSDENASGASIKSVMTMSCSPESDV